MGATTHDMASKAAMFPENWKVQQKDVSVAPTKMCNYTQTVSPAG